MGVVLLTPREVTPPSTDEQFRLCAAALADDRLAKAIAGAVALSPIHSFGVGRNRLRHLERTAWPDGLLALGDVVLELDPYYGLGMSNAAQAAVALGAFLDNGLGGPGDAGMAVKFQAQLAQSLADAWLLITDPAHPGQAARRILHALAPDNVALSRELFHHLHGLGAAVTLPTVNPGETPS